jgi:aspartate-semialdehyde dehydrogenase
MERRKVGILGATGMVGQRFIQLLHRHPWFEIAWLAASERSAGKRYEDACRWKLDTPLPAEIAAMTLMPNTPDGTPSTELPRIIFAALDAAIAHELEPKFAAAGCAVISNSSAFRMTSDVPLVVPEVNADHLALIEAQSWRKESGGYIVTNPNCCAIGLVLALAPLEQRFGIESLFVSTMQAVSGAGYPGVASLDILGNVVPFIKNEEEKLQEEVGKLLGAIAGDHVEMLHAKLSAAYGVREHQAAQACDLRGDAGGMGGVPAAEGHPRRARSALCAGVSGGVCGRDRPAAAAAGPDARQRHGDDGWAAAALQSARLEVCAAFA